MGFFGDAGFQPDQVEAETGVQRIGQGIQLLVQKPQHYIGIAQRRAGADCDALHLAVGAEEHRFQKAQALALTFKSLRQCDTQRVKAFADDILSHDRLGKTMRGAEIGQGPARGERLFLRPQHHMQTGEEVHAQPRGQFGAASVGYLRDGLEAGTFERSQLVFAAIQRGDGQWRNHGPVRAGRRDSTCRVTRQRARRQRCARDSSLDRETLCGDFLPHMLKHHRFAAEKMRNAADVQQQAVGRIDRHQRCEAVAPIGDALQKREVGFLVGRHDRQILDHGAGIGQRLAAMKAQPLRVFVQRIDIERVVGAARDDQGCIFGCCFRRAAAEAPQPVGRQARKPQGQNAPPPGGRFHVRCPIAW